VVKPGREQLVVRVEMVKHEGHVLLESCGDDDVENDVEEVNIVVFRCVPLVYGARDIIEDHVVMPGDGAGDL
jgi:hypothetical protein